MKDITLFIPQGYGRGTIVFDLEGNTFEVGDDTHAGGNLRYVHPVPKEYAEIRIKNGASKLASE